MPSTEILRVRSCIYIAVILHFHLELMSKSVGFRTKTDEAGLYNYIT